MGNGKGTSAPATNVARGFGADAYRSFSCHASRNMVYSPAVSRRPKSKTPRSKNRLFATIVGLPAKKIRADRSCRAESIGFNHIGTGPEIFFVDALDRLRFRQQQKFDRAFEVLAFPIAKTFTAIIRFGQAEALQSCAHRTVEHDDALLQKRGKRVGCVWHEREETSFRARFKEQIDVS